MTVSAEMLDYQAGHPIVLVPIWKFTSRDGTTAAYCGHSRPTIGRGFNPANLFIFGGTTYVPAPAQSMRDIHKIGLSPNSTQISGVFDDTFKREDVEGGRWKLAKVTYEYVCPLDLTMGSTGKIVGVIGKIDIRWPTYDVEVLSNANLLQQQIGELTSPTDRNTFPAGLDKATWTVTRNVVSSTDRRNLVIDGTAKPNSWFKYGVIIWSSGGNTVSLGMEIKDNVGNAIELQLPMPRDIVAGDIVTLLAGYDGTREQARGKFDDMINFDGEADLPGLKTLLSYPES